MLGVVNDNVPVPPASTAPPVADAYQSTVSPVATVAVNVSVPGPHLAKVAAPAAGGEGIGVTETGIAVLVAETQLVTVFRVSA